MCRSLKSNVQANGLYKRPQLLHLQLDTYNEGGVVMTSAQVAEQIKSIFPLFYIQGKSPRVIIDLRCSSFFIMQTDMLYTKKRKSLNYWNSRTYNFVFLFSAEREGTEPKHPTAYKSVFYFPIFQIGNETVTIFINAFVRLCPLFVCLSHGFKDTTLFRITQMPEYKRYHVGARCKLYI